MIRMGDVTAYIVCPRLCYYRVHCAEDSFTEVNAAKEIYVSYRQDFDLEWAEERCRNLYDFFDEHVFSKAAEKFILSPELAELKAVDWDVVVKSAKLGVVMTVDEIVECNGKRYPLFVSTNPPERDVWFRDAVKAAVAYMLGVGDSSYFYYAYAGELREFTPGLGVRRRAIKLIERVKMVKRGFLPERKESGYCKYCSFSEECRMSPETFASKFL